MKKILGIAIALFSTAYADAQTTTTSNATLNVELTKVMGITVNPDQDNVTLAYEDIDDYRNGVTVSEADHLTVYSTGAFAVQVKADGNLAGTGSNTGTIDVTTINIVPAAGTSNGSNGISSDATYSPVPLSSTATTILSSDTAAIDGTVNIDYAGAGNNKYVNIAPDTYTTNLTYTIIAK